MQRLDFAKIINEEQKYKKTIKYVNPHNKKQFTQTYLFILTDQHFICYEKETERDNLISDKKFILKISDYPILEDAIMHMYSIYYRIFDLDKKPKTKRGLHNRHKKTKMFSKFKEDNFFYQENYY